MKKLILAIALGTLALFVWNALSWMVFKMHDHTYQNIPETVVEGANLKAAMPERGVYHYPGLPEDGNWEEAVPKMEQGPVISLMVYLPNGLKPFSPVSFLLSLLLNFIAVGLACYFLMRTNLTSYGSSVLFVGLLGVFAGIVVEIPKGIWYGFPTQYILVHMIDYIAGWFLVGAILGKIIR